MSYQVDVNAEYFNLLLGSNPWEVIGVSFESWVYIGIGLLAIFIIYLALLTFWLHLRIRKLEAKRE